MRVARIMNICRLRRDIDGAGITTLILMHGCHLRCKYCLNNYCHDNDIDIRGLSVEELLSIVRIDDAYFKMSGGGITFGGGEPLLQAYFIKEFAEIMPEGWRLRVETSLNVPWKAVELLIPYVDEWIIDIKDMRPEIYLVYTGIENAQVLDNLEKLYMRAGGQKLHIRIPIIKGYNTQEDVQVSLQGFEKYSCKKEVFSYTLPVR